MRYPIFQVLLPYPAETQAAVEVLEMGLCTDLDRLTAVRSKENLQGIPHKGTTQPPPPYRWGGDDPADTGVVGIADAPRQEAGIGDQLVVQIPTYVDRRLVIPIGVLVPAGLLDDEYLLAEGHNLVQFVNAQLTKCTVTPIDIEFVHGSE